MKQRIYTADEVHSALDEILERLHPMMHRQEETMPKKIRKRVIVDGEERWVCGDTTQEVFDNYRKLIGLPKEADEGPTVCLYLKDFVARFKKGQATLTEINRERMIKNHIEPWFDGVRLSSLNPALIQEWLDSLNERYSHETVLKAKNILSPALDAAVEDGYLRANPLKSPRIHIGGAEGKHHKAIPKEKMEEVRGGLSRLERRERLMAALLSYEGLRFEEVLGLRWEDISGGMLHVCRAVVHPTRNQPEVKEPKTKSSARKVPVAKEIADILVKESRNSGFVVCGKEEESPLTYTQARRSFEKIRREFGLEEYSAHDFRDTCATEWREKGVPMDVIARLLGHAKTETTEQRYVKYRDDILSGCM